VNKIPALPALPRLIKRSLVLVGLMLVPVLLAAVLFSQQAVLGVGIGLALMTSVVRALAPRERWFAAGAGAIVAAAGSYLGPESWWLLPAVVAVCLVQGWFARHSVQAVAILPAMLMLSAQNSDHTQWLTVGLATLAGSAYLLVLAQLMGLAGKPKPIAARLALAHSALLGIGCLALVLLSRYFEIHRANWALLAFCIMFTPDLLLRKNNKAVLGYLAAVTGGAVLAALVGVISSPVLTLAVLACGAVATVAGSLAGQPAIGVSSVTLTVILLSSIASDESIGYLSVQRAGLAFLSLIVAGLMVLVGRLVQRRLVQRHHLE